jgi:hypothetical protein
MAPDEVADFRTGMCVKVREGTVPSTTPAPKA